MADRWNGRVRAAVAALVGSALIVGCGASDDAADDESSTTTSAAAVSDERALQPAGSAIADGLTVPEGTQLAGTVFATPSEVDGHDDWTAYLTLDGDPFAAWDGLAAQLRDGEQPFEIAGSADACTWMWNDDAPVPESTTAAPSTGAPATGEPTTGSAPATPTTAVPAEDPYLAAVTITDQPPAPEIDGIDCSASAPATVDGATQQVTVRLRSGARWAPTMTVSSQWTSQPQTNGPVALRTTLERQARQGGGPDPVPGPATVPAAASEHVPPALEQEAPEPGDGFGTEVNCFAEDGGYHQLTLPDGATFVAGGFEDGVASVLAVDDAAAAIEDIQRQTAGDGTSDDGEGTTGELTLADGGTVTEFGFSVSGGGGGCGARSSADGRFLVVTVHGD